MSKNLTRKGLALGAVVALGSSLFAGTPASAAPTALYLQSAFGTSTTGVLGQYFTLAASALGRVTADEVKFYVEGVAAANVSATARVVTDLTASGSYSVTPAETSVDADAKQTSYTSGTSAWTAGSYYQFAIKVDSTAVTATTSVKVTPYLDSVVADNKPGANELVGTAVTINFVKGSELTATPTITAPVGAKANAIVAVTGGVNVEQFRAAADGGHAETPFTVLFKQDGADFGSAVNALYNTTDKVLTVDSASNTTAGKIYGATAKINGTDSGAASAVTATAGKASSLSGVAVAKGTSYAATGASSSSNVIRSGAGSISASTTVTAVSGESKAGQKVTFTVTEFSVSALAAGGSVSAGGKTLTNAASGTTEKFTVDVTSDADGKATLPITYAGLADGNKISVSATAVGASSTVSATGIDLTAQDSVATAIVDLVQDTATSITPVRQIAKAGSFSIAYKVVDQFGQTPTGSFRVAVTNTNAISTPSITTPIAVSSGTVTVSGTDNNTADDVYEVVATLQKLGTDGTTWSNVGSVAETSTISAGTVGTPSALAITATATDNVTRAGQTLVAGNTVLEQSSVDRTAPSGSETLTTVVTSSTGAVVAGAAVTYSAAGVLFKAGNTYGLGSITVYTNASGSTGAVNIHSNLSGASTITVTSGSATKTQVITWAAVTSGGSAWTITAPTYILPGQTLKVSAVLKDKYGALVNTASGDVKVVYTGAGFVTATLPTETDADGSISFTVLLGAADSGTATAKFIYEGVNGTLEETSSNDDVVSSATITLGAAPVAGATAAIAGSTKRFFVSVSGNTGARNVVVKVAGRTFATLKGSTAAKRTYTVRAPKGSHKVTVFVGGKLIATKTISVK
jgi:trimeric autotransporter adhesin